LSKTSPTKTSGELGCSRRVSSSCAISGTRHVTLVKNLIRKEDRIVIQMEHDPWSFVTQIFRSN
jgi:hypothetical protein